MLPTVQLDDQADFQASEVGKVDTYGTLPAELQAKHLAIA
jgi:hypothetical protein